MVFWCGWCGRKVNRTKWTAEYPFCTVRCAANYGIDAGSGELNMERVKLRYDVFSGDKL